MAPGIATKPTTATCYKITAMLAEVMNRSLEVQKNAIRMTKKLLQVPAAHRSCQQPSANTGCPQLHIYSAKAAIPAPYSGAKTSF